MVEALPELLLVAGLVLINAVLAGSEIALISLREAQLVRLEREGGAGRVVARLARDPNRFLATIQIGITLSGFLASAAAAVSLAEPLVPVFGLFGGAAESVAILVVTLILSFFTLVLGELAPKRIALQRSEQWARVIARPLHVLAVVSKPAVWLLSVSTDAVVRLLGGEPAAAREEIDLEEMREMVMSHRRLHEDHQEVLLGAFEVAERAIADVMTPRPRVFTLDTGTKVEDAMRLLAGAGHTRAPVVRVEQGLDAAVGIVNIVDLVLVDPGSFVEDHAGEPVVLPESVLVLSALRTLQQRHQQMALVVDEFGGIDGIVTAEDLVEELVGEIYDETDRDVLSARSDPDGSVVVPGSFPIHDLVDLGIEVPDGEYRTVAGLILERLGRIGRPGDEVRVNRWELAVESAGRRTVDVVRFVPLQDVGGDEVLSDLDAEE
jgi:putative hemolysin